MAHLFKTMQSLCGIIYPPICVVKLFHIFPMIDTYKPTTYSGLTTKLFHIEFLALSNTFQNSMLEAVEEYNVSESTGDIILETNNTRMEDGGPRSGKVGSLFTL